MTDLDPISDPGGIRRLALELALDISADEVDEIVQVAEKLYTFLAGHTFLVAHA
jgi:predicted translin family RNA/ssDNA-binding protein